VLLVVTPVAREDCSVVVLVDALTICFVMSPLTLKYVTICMRELAAPMRLVVVPVALILGSVRPGLNSVSFFDIAISLSSVDGAILVEHWTSIMLLDASAIDLPGDS